MVSSIEFGEGEILGSPRPTRFDRWLETRKHFSTDRVAIQTIETRRGDGNPSRGRTDPPSELARVARECFWRLDPLGVAPWADSTYDEYFDVADGVAARIERGEDFLTVESALARELRDDWELEEWAGVAHQVVTAMQTHLRNTPVSPSVHASSDASAARVRAFHVHPAFSGPLEIGREIGAGVVDDDLPDWWHRLDEDEQQLRLRNMWVALCAWGEEQGVDEVRVDTFSCSGRELMDGRGFEVARPSVVAALFSRSLCGPATLRAAPETVAASLRVLPDIPVIQLDAYSAGRLVMEVDDLNWDSMIAHTDEPGSLARLPFANR